MYVDSTNEVGDSSDQTAAALLREHIEPLLMVSHIPTLVSPALIASVLLIQKYNVDLALWGHHHSYQRTCHVYKEKCTENAPLHLVIGMAGQGLSQNLK